MESKLLSQAGILEWLLEIQECLPDLSNVPDDESAATFEEAFNDLVWEIEYLIACLQQALHGANPPVKGPDTPYSALQERIFESKSEPSVWGRLTIIIDHTRWIANLERRATEGSPTAQEALKAIYA